MRLRHGSLLGIACLTLAAWLPAGREPIRADKPKVADRTDFYGDPLPEGARARLGTIRYHTIGYPIAIAVSPDNRSLACLGNLGTITLLDMTTGKQLRHFAGGRARGRAYAPQTAHILRCRLISSRVPA